jgi:hypothetical protein
MIIESSGVLSRAIFFGHGSERVSSTCDVRVSNRSATVQSVRQLGSFASVSQLRIVLESVSQLE